MFSQTDRQEVPSDGGGVTLGTQRAGSSPSALWAMASGSAAIVALLAFLVHGPPQPPAPRPPASVAPGTPAAEATAPVPPPDIASREAERAAPVPAAGIASPLSRPSSLPAGAAPATALAPGALAHAEVREIQGRLRAIGFDPCPVDGAAGPRTVNAARH